MSVMVLINEGIVNDSIKLQPLKRFSPTYIKDDEISIDFNDEHPQNTLAPIVVTDEGIVINSIDSQLQNEFLPLMNNF